MATTTFSADDFKAMKQYFLSGEIRSEASRKKQLKLLRNVVKQFTGELSEALYKDLHKSAAESFITEIGFVLKEIEHTLKYLGNWMEVQRVPSPLLVFPSRSKIVREPVGLVLIIAPWNYPFQLLFGPLIGAIAGGNCAVLKPSELAPATALVIERMISENFDNRFIKVVQGEGSVVVPTLINDHRFNHIFFTGSTVVGKEIAKMAANEMVPVTLELGGKSPCIVDEDVDIKVAAGRITWGKFTNAGQTCVAPDYLLVHESRKQQLIELIKENIETFYGSDPSKSDEYGRIINERRFDKLVTYLQQGDIVTGGQTKREELYISPTVMENAGIDQPLMKDEIFGPILPVYTFKSHDEAMALINQNPDPLSLYIFSNNKTVQQLYTSKVSYGGACINNTLVHLGNSELPFGGVGNSGVGAYHGKFSFDTFTRPKSILKTGTWFDPSIKYPPYKQHLNLLKRFFS